MVKNIEYKSRSGKEKKASDTIIDNLFGEFKKLLWIEPPYSEDGKRMEVWHYRLFCDENWQPIKPRGEVYNTHFTERGWKSFSELQFDKSVAESVPTKNSEPT